MVPSSGLDAFPARLKAAREARQLSQADLAGRTGLQASAISHFETGTRKPSFANLRRLADALDVSTDYLLGRSEVMSGGTSVDLMFRDMDKLSARDREVIATLAKQMAAGKRRGGGDGNR